MLSNQLQTFNEAGTILIGKDGKLGDQRAPYILLATHATTMTTAIICSIQR